MTKFQPASAYQPATEGYHLLPFRFRRWHDGDVLLVNLVGEHTFLRAGAFQEFVTHQLPRDADCYDDLKAQHFLTDTSSTVPLELLATKYRTKHSFLVGPTLHLLIVTLRCDHSCPYCQVSRVTEDRTTYDMTRETADRALDLIFQSPAPALKLEFQGGEPLLNFPLIEYLITQAEKRNESAGRQLEFVIATNLSPLTDDMLAFCKAHGITLSTSLDGPAFLHDTHRPRRGGNSHATMIANLARARAVLGHDGVSAVMTTTARSLAYAREIIDEYVQQEFTSIFLRPISPYGFATRTKLATQYAAHHFLDFYREGLAYLIELNRRGTPIIEVYTQLLLRKILTPFPTGYVDLQSPAGAATSVLAYNYDGDVYASDEARMLAEMHDHTFRLGNVHTTTYPELTGGRTAQLLRHASILETMPGCSTCAFLPYCGADPVYHWTTQNDPIGHRPTSGFCTRQTGIFDHLLTLLKTGDDFIRQLFTSWATEQPLRIS